MYTLYFVKYFALAILCKVCKIFLYVFQLYKNPIDKYLFYVLVVKIVNDDDKGMHYQQHKEKRHLFIYDK